MSLSSLAANQLVAREDMVNSGTALVSGQFHETGTQCVTKDYLLAKYQVDPVPLNPLAGNQLVRRQDVNSSSSISYQVGLALITGTHNGSYCGLSYDPFVTYYINTPALQIHTKIWTDAAMTINILDVNPSYSFELFYDSNFEVVDIDARFGWVEEMFACSTTIYSTSEYVNDPCLQQGVYTDGNGNYFTSAAGNNYLDGQYYQYSHQNGPNEYIWNRFYFYNSPGSPNAQGYVNSGCLIIQ